MTDYYLLPLISKFQTVVQFLVYPQLELFHQAFVYQLLLLLLLHPILLKFLLLLSSFLSQQKSSLSLGSISPRQSNLQSASDTGSLSTSHANQDNIDVTKILLNLVMIQSFIVMLPIKLVISTICMTQPPTLIPLLH